jgi:hypothetical protein
VTDAEKLERYNEALRRIRRGSERQNHTQGIGACVSAEREARIREYRLRQPRAELERKAAKAADRAKLWTQEEFDAADAEARDLAAYFASKQ